MTSSIEPLEARIAPATLVNPTTVTYHDQDGDLVTLKLTKALLTDVATANAILHFDTGVVVAAGAPDLTTQQLQLIQLAGHAGAGDGTGIAVSVKVAGNGDGFANVGRIEAAGIPLGVVTIKGDLGSILAGNAPSNFQAVKSLTVQSMGQYGTTTQGATPSLTSDLTRGLGSLTVKSDLVGVYIHTLGGSEAGLGSLTVGGSILGTAADDSGHLEITGPIGVVKIGRDLAGGDGNRSGSITTLGSIKSITLGGSLLGGNGAPPGDILTGSIVAGGDMGAIKIGGDIIANSYAQSGKIAAGGKITSLTVRGSIVGGALSADGAGDAQEGQINGDLGIGPITIGGDLRGGVGTHGAAIESRNGSIGAVKIGGSVVGVGLETASVTSFFGMGAVTIGGDLRGGDQGSGLILAELLIPSVTVKGSLIGGTGNGAGTINGDAGLGPVKIGGSVIGGSANETGEIWAFGKPIKSVTIGGSLLGGSSLQSGTIYSLNAIGSVTIVGDVIGGGGVDSGSIDAKTGVTGRITINGLLKGGAGQKSGAIQSIGGLPGVTIGGSLIAGTDTNAGAILATKDIDSLTIKGGVFGTAGHHATIAAGGVSAVAQAYVALQKITITGDVQFADIIAGSALGATSGDGQIGSISIGGDFIASSIAAGVNPGPTGYGIGDTLLPGGAATAKLATIASITIAGQALGTPGGADQYGIVAELIKSIKIGGNALPLTPTAHTDNRPLGTTGDLTIHEV